MSSLLLNPIIKLSPEAESREKVLRAVYSIGYIRRGIKDPKEALVFVPPYMEYIALIAAPDPFQNRFTISAYNKKDVEILLHRKRHFISNSVFHAVAYLKAKGIVKPRVL